MTPTSTAKIDEMKAVHTSTSRARERAVGHSSELQTPANKISKRRLATARPASASVSVDAKPDRLRCPAFVPDTSTASPIDR